MTTRIAKPKWVFEHVVETTARPEDVWRLWEDFSARQTWDDVEWARLHGPFEAGTTGEWKPSFMPAMQLWLEDVDRGRAFSVAATHARRVGLLRYRHELRELPDGRTQVVHRLEVSGPLARLIGRFAGRRMARELPAVMTRLAAIAEQPTRPAA